MRMSPRNASRAVGGYDPTGGIVEDIAAAAAIAGPVLSFIGGQQTNSANQANALQAESFSEQMADTTYQRGVADMRAAGLNPILAASIGGDPSPTGVMPTAVSGIGQMASALPGAVRNATSTAQQAQRIDNETAALHKDLQKKDAEIDVLNENAKVQNHEAVIKGVDAVGAAEMWKKRFEAAGLGNEQTKAATGRLNKLSDILDLNTTSARADADRAQMDIDRYNTQAGKIAYQTGGAAADALPMFHASSAFKSLLNSER